MAKVDIDAPGTQVQFADLADISQPAANDLLQRGVIRPGDSLRAQLHAYLRHLRAVAAGRVESPALADERVRLTRARREAIEFNAKVQRGVYVRAADFRAAAFSASRVARDQLLGIGARVGPLVAAESEPATCMRLIDSEVRRALDEVVIALSRDLPAPADADEAPVQ